VTQLLGMSKPKVG